MFKKLILSFCILFSFLTISINHFFSLDNSISKNIKVLALNENDNSFSNGTTITPIYFNFSSRDSFVNFNFNPKSSEVIINKLDTSFNINYSFIVDTNFLAYKTSLSLLSSIVSNSLYSNSFNSTFSIPFSDFEFVDFDRVFKIAYSINFELSSFENLNFNSSNNILTFDLPFVFRILFFNGLDYDEFIFSNSFNVVFVYNIDGQEYDGYDSSNLPSFSNILNSLSDSNIASSFNFSSYENVYDEAFNEGFDGGFEVGYQTGYDEGVLNGGSSILNNPFDLIYKGFTAVSSFFSLEIAPGLTIGLIAIIPLAITIIIFLFKSLVL